MTVAATLPEHERSWHDLGHDIGWEARSSGVIRCISVRNRRSDIHAAVEGVNLADIFCEIRGTSALDAITGATILRQVAVRLPGALRADRVYMSAKQLESGGMIGTFTVLPARQDEALLGQAVLLSKVSDARNREESHRQEAEMMLRGLRLLLGGEPAADKLDALARLMVEAIKGDVHLLLREGRDGVIRPLNGDATRQLEHNIGEAWRGQDGAVAVHGDASPYIGRLRRMLNVEDCDVAAMVLPFALEDIVVLCAGGRRRRFRTEDIGFAGRFALILKQAMALKEEQDKLIQSARLSVLGQMSASLAHELRQPLNTIGMAAQNLELLAEKGAVEPQALAAKITRILGQVTRASQIIDRVRRFSRKAGDNFAPTDLALLAVGVRALSEHRLQAAGVRLELDVPANLSVACDAVQVEQVLANLVGNALDAIAGIGSAVAATCGVIWIRARQSEYGVVIRVEDSGPGFPPGLLDKPIEAFFTTKDAEKGTGLGLSICNTIAREHGGKLELGNHSKGAFAALHLPARKAQAGSP